MVPAGYRPIFSLESRLDEHTDGSGPRYGQVLSGMVPQAVLWWRG